MRFWDFSYYFGLRGLRSNLLFDWYLFDFRGILYRIDFRYKRYGYLRFMRSYGYYFDCLDVSDYYGGVLNMLFISLFGINNKFIRFPYMWLYRSHNIKFYDSSLVNQYITNKELLDAKDRYDKE